MSNKNMYRQVLILECAAIFQTVSVLVMTIGGLAGGFLPRHQVWLPLRLRPCSSNGIGHVSGLDVDVQSRA
ncbi:MAG: hypothetical protein KJJ56_16760 [Serratia rubidaea]|nr:hypothetical protein [Serratia rubidaea]